MAGISAPGLTVFGSRIHARKLSGVFACETVAVGHAFMAGLAPRRVIPHSRYYGLEETALAAAGYGILSRSAIAGVDTFVGGPASQFLFFQGHPEYEPETLLQEFRRDVRRFVLGKSTEYPYPPIGYFSPSTEATLSDLRQQALRGRRDQGLFDEVCAVVAEAARPEGWHDAAERLYANWRACVARRRRRDPPATDWLREDETLTTAAN